MEKVHEIDLRTMIPSANRINKPTGNAEKKQTAIFADGELSIHSYNDIECMQTSESYSFPLRIDATVKTDSTNIRLYYKEGRIIFNWEIRKDDLLVSDILTGRGFDYSGMGRVPENEYVDVTWIIGRSEMLVLVNEELRHIEDDSQYMSSRAVLQKQKIIEPVRISAAIGSTITIKSLKVTELEN